MNKNSEKQSKSGRLTEFWRLLDEMGTDEFTITELREFMLEKGFYSEAVRQSMIVQAIDDDLRRLVRKPRYDEDGTRIELVNIKRHKPLPGQKQQVFAYLHLTDQDDLELVIKDRIKKRNYFDDEVRRFLGVYGERFGDKAKRTFQRKLNFDHN